MKNKYEIRGDVTAIFLNHKGKVIEALIDTEDLEKAISFPNSYCGHYSAGNIYVGGLYFNDRGKRITMRIHRLIMGYPIGKVIDHINHNTLDNRKCNLRAVTQEENMQNLKGANSLSTTGVLGVLYDKQSGKFQAHVRKKRKYIFRKNFDSLEEAEKAIQSFRASTMEFSKEAELFDKDQAAKHLHEIDNRVFVREIKGGVSWKEKNKKWQVRVKIDGIRKYIGIYRDKADAEKALEEVISQHKKDLHK